jgi:hypothetical protein
LEEVYDGGCFSDRGSGSYERNRGHADAPEGGRPQAIVGAVDFQAKLERLVGPLEAFRQAGLGYVHHRPRPELRGGAAHRRSGAVLHYVRYVQRKTIGDVVGHQRRPQNAVALLDYQVVYGRLDRAGAEFDVA